MATIQLTTGQICIVDDADFEMLCAHNWYHYCGGYARTIHKNQFILMHRLLLDAPENLEVDHINGDRLDNRRSNLRLATVAQNQWNRGAPRNNTSGYKGVNFSRRYGKWMARIACNGIRINLGYFATPEEAHEVYKSAAAKFHGEFANCGAAA